MKFHTQRFIHDPDNGFYGDCFRTAIACLLDLEPEEVPHFAEKYWNDTTAWDLAAEEFLASRGLAPVTFSFTDELGLQGVLNLMGNVNRGVYYLLSGRSRNGTCHVVIGLNDAIAHDSAIDSSGIVGPMDNGCYSVTVLVPLSQTNRLKEAA